MTTQTSQKWKKVKLSDLGSVERGRSRHRPRNDASLYGGVYPFIQTGDIKSANFYIDSYTQTYSEKGLAQSKLWNPDTLCITIAANIGESAILKMPACFPDSVVGFQSYKNISDVRYVKYLLDLIKNQFQAISQGTTQDNLSLEKLLSINLDVPEYSTQKQVADVLCVYDNLIANNSRRIKILEDLTQKIYSEWFQDFRFPGYEKSKFGKNGLPNGWKIEKIRELIQTVKRKDKLKTNEYLSIGEYPIVDQGKDFISGYTNDISAVYKEHLIVFGDHTRCFKYCNFDFACGADGTQLLKTRNPANLPEILLYFLVKNVDLKSNHYARHFKFLKEIDVIIPDEQLANSFAELVTPFFDCIRGLSLENAALIKSRDLLIPQVVTGKLEINI